MLSADRQTPDTLGQEPREVIAFRVGSQEFCVDVRQVKEIRGWSPATRLPRSPVYVHGVINLRGTVLPIIDIAARLELPANDPSPHHVVIVVWTGGKLVGLLVDAVSDILAIGGDAVQATPEVGCETVQAIVKALVSVDGRMMGLLALERVLPICENTDE